MQPRWRFLLVGLTVLALVLAPLAGADAKKKHHKKKHHKKDEAATTTLSIDRAEGQQVSGDLSSGKDICVGDRVVRVTRNGTSIGSDRTDEDGSWSVATSPELASPDQIVARVDEITIKKNKKKKVTCSADSDDFTVGETPTNPAGNFTLNVDVIDEADTTHGTVTSSPGGISCRDNDETPPNPGTCVADFPAGSTVTLTAVPDENQDFDTWGGACTPAGTSTTCQVVMTEPKSVTAAFGGCAPTGTPLDPILCIVIDLLGG